MFGKRKKSPAELVKSTQNNLKVVIDKKEDEKAKKKVIGENKFKYQWNEIYVIW